MKTMTKKHTTFDHDKWDAYTMMDFTVAIILVVVSMVSAEVPRSRAGLARQTAPAAPYVASGWRPNGQLLSLPIKAQPQQAYGPPQPAASYGPPSEEPEATTTEQPTTTEAFAEESAAQQAKPQNLKVEPRKSEKLEEPQGQFYVVLPQGQNLLYTIPQSASLVAAPRANLVAAPARLQAVPVSTSVTSSVFTPYSASYVQIYQ